MNASCQQIQQLTQGDPVSLGKKKAGRRIESIPPPQHWRGYISAMTQRISALICLPCRKDEHFMVGNIHEGTHSSWEFSRDGKGFGIAVVVVDSHSEDEEGIAGESGEGTSSLTSTN